MKATSKVETSSVKKKVLKSPKKVAQKKASKKSPVFLKVSTTKDKLDSKLKKITELHQKNVRATEEKVALAPQSYFSEVLALRPKFELALMSPYRFPVPVDSQKIAVGIARYSGVLFVLLGAIGTVFFSQTLSADPSRQIANIYTTNQDLKVDPNHVAIDCQNPLLYSSDTCSQVVDQTPEAKILITGDATALQGAVQVITNVTYAREVKLYAKHAATGQVKELGAMTSLSYNSWEHYIDTTKLLDGIYTFTANVTNAYGTYETSFNSNVTVANTPLTVSSNTATTSLSTSPSVEEVQRTSALLSAVSLMSPDFFRLSIKAPEADTVKMFVSTAQNQTLRLLGNAYKSTTDIWKYRFDATNYPDGEYVVRAQVVRDGVQTYTEEIKLVKKQQTGSATTTVATSPEVPKEAEIKPSISIDIQSNVPLQGSVGLKIDVLDAQKVEVYGLKVGELSQRFLGNAKQVDSDTWVYFVETKNIPNGEYQFVSKVTNSFGSYEKSTEKVAVDNKLATITSQQEEKIVVIETIEKERVAATAPLVESDSRDSTDEPQELREPTITVPTTETSTDAQLKLEEDTLNRLALAVRLGDLEEVKKIQSESITAGAGTESDQERSTKLRDYIAFATKNIEERVVSTNKLFEERTSEKATLDSDKDGIVDYDEVTLFKTNPFVADSDADGFLDGAEIEGGFDPNNTKAEALIAYESPKEAGITKSEVLEVLSIVPAVADAEEVESKTAAAIISGKALPHSFVSLYIFSTPIIVTVKTEADGSWAYRFDKELEDGEHEIYVGVTDNAGKIVAKSNVFTFVKEAEAFSGTTKVNAAAPEPVPEVEDVSLLSRYTIYLVLSISVVAIGLVLILLGLHLDARARLPKKEVFEEKTA